MSELVLDIQEMAHDMGDDFGFETDTVEAIAKYFTVPKDFVEQALDLGVEVDTEE
jgi:uncharacterized protein YaaR (DUF327 family)